MKTNNNGRHFVLFGPANAGKSTILGYLQTLNYTEQQFASEILKIQTKIGDKFRTDSLFTFFVDDSTDEYTKVSDMSDSVNDERISYGTSKYVHIRRFGNFCLIDTPGGTNYAAERYRGLSLAEIGIFVVEIQSLLNFNTENFRLVNDFFTTWYIWKKTHGVGNSIILLTKYDLVNHKDDYEKAKENLLRIICESQESIVIIPTSISCKERKDINITDNRKLDWYSGPSLIDAIKSKSANKKDLTQSQESLFMFYNKNRKIEGFGEVMLWKINSGILNIKDKVTIFPVKIGDCYDAIDASIKNLSDDIGNNIEEALPGSLVNLVFSKYVDKKGNPLSRKNFEFARTAVITGREDSDIIIGNRIELEINNNDMNPNEENILNNVSDRRDVSIVWFGNLIHAQIDQKEKKDKGYLLTIILKNDFVGMLESQLSRNVVLQIDTNYSSSQIPTYKCFIRGVQKV